VAKDTHGEATTRMNVGRRRFGKHLRLLISHHSFLYNETAAYEGPFDW